MYYLYILRSQTKPWHYIGSTQDIANRVAEHNSGEVRSTKAYRPFKLIYQEQFIDKRAARQRELFLKKTSRARVELLAQIDMASSSSG